MLGRIVERRRIMAELRRSERAGSRRALLRPGVLIGVGVPATLDEVVLHQLLHWHHFRDRSTPAGQLWAGALLGAGGFNPYDGTVQHKLLGFHQVREGVPDSVPYDAASIGLAMLVLLAGVAVLRGSRPVAARDARGAGRC